MSVLIFVPEAMPSFGRDGQPVIASLQFYENDTTNPTTVYADPALSVPLEWPVPSNSSGQFPAIWAPDAAIFTVVWSTNDGQSTTWDEISGATSADAAILAASTAAKVAAQAAQTGAEAAEDSAAAILAQIIAIGGDDGFTPVLRLVADGARIVVGITWTGGDGPPPTSGYLGTTGVVTLIASAVDIRGPSGPGTGNVLTSGTPTTGTMATWVSGTAIKGDTAYDYSTLPNKPAFGNAVLLNLASQAEAVAGTANDKLMTPLRVSQVLAGSSGAIMPRTARSSNYQLLANDRGGLTVATGSFTLSFDTAASLGAGWYHFVQNAGTGDVTIPGTDGLTSFFAYPGEIRLFQSDGTTITSYVLKGFSKTFTASGSFVKPPGYLDFEGDIWGGGGSGLAGGGGGAGGAGGAGAACLPFKVPASSVGATETVTIAAGGAATTNSSGLPGGNSTFGTIATGYGGGGGGASAPGGGGQLGAPSGTTGGAPSAAGVTNPGFGGGDGGGFSSIYGGGGGGTPTVPGGNSIYGGAAGGGASASGLAESLGGTSRFGGNGGRGRYNANGVSGSAPGGGGGATDDITKTSGAGGRGELRIRGVA